MLCLSAFFTAEATRIRRNPKPIYVPKSAPNDAGVPLESFVSFSFELSSWPDFAGNLSAGLRKMQLVLIGVLFRKPIAPKHFLG